MYFIALLLLVFNTALLVFLGYLLFIPGFLKDKARIKVENRNSYIVLLGIIGFIIFSLIALSLVVFVSKIFLLSKIEISILPLYLKIFFSCVLLVILGFATRKIMPIIEKNLLSKIEKNKVAIITLNTIAIVLIGILTLVSGAIT